MIRNINQNAIKTFILWTGILMALLLLISTFSLAAPVELTRFNWLELKNLFAIQPQAIVDQLSHWTESIFQLIAKI